MAKLKCLKVLFMDEINMEPELDRQGSGVQSHEDVQQDHDGKMLNTKYC